MKCTAELQIARPLDRCSSPRANERRQRQKDEELEPSPGLFGAAFAWQWTIGNGLTIERSTIGKEFRA